MSAESKHRCNITYGIILCYVPDKPKYNFEDIEFFYCHRKDSIWYAEFLRGHLSEDKLSYYMNFITKEEYKRLKDFNEGKYSFNELWEDMCMHKRGGKRKEKQKEKFNDMKESGKLTELLSSIKATKDHYVEFPKGRRENKESSLSTAIREFREETNISPSLIDILNAKPVELKYTGTDGDIYTIHYFIGITRNKLYPHCINSISRFREYTVSNEVSKIGWAKFNECESMLSESQKPILEKVKSKLNLFGSLLYDTTNSKVFIRKPALKKSFVRKR